MGLSYYALYDMSTVELNLAMTRAVPWNNGSHYCSVRTDSVALSAALCSVRSFVPVCRLVRRPLFFNSLLPQHHGHVDKRCPYTASGYRTRLEAVGSYGKIRNRVWLPTKGTAGILRRGHG